jgi:mono/diheme cytochrome c family protein
MLLCGCGGPPDPRVEGIVSLTGSSVAGETVFTSQKCGDCHGKAGRGGFGPDLGSGDVHATPKDELANTLLQGRLFMPSFKAKLSDQDVADVLAFVDTLGR